jgi:hypothetical protein
MNGETGFVIGIFGAIGLTLVTSTYLAMNDRLATVIFTSGPSLDFVSDVAYVTQVKFYNKTVFILAVVVLFLSSGMFVQYVVRKKVRPAFLIPFPGTFFSLNLWWLSSSKGSPYIDGRAAPGGFEQHNNIPKFVVFCFRWLVLVTAQILFCGVYAVWMCVHTIFWWGPLLLLGCFLFQLKSICVKRVWNAWVSLFTLTPTKVKRHCGNFRRWWVGEKLVDPDDDLFIHWKTYNVADTDAGMFNESLLFEFLFESIPQLLLQGLNNTYTFQWFDPITLSSFAFSGFMVVNGIWTLAYPVLIDGIAVNDVPVRLNIFGYVIQIKTEAAEHDESKFLKRHKLALMAWKELSGEFGRLTSMNRADPIIGASADAIMLAFQASHIVNVSGLTPENVSKVIANLGDKPAVKLYRVRKLHEFDEECAQERERLRLDALEAPSHSREHQPTDITHNPMVDSAGVDGGSHADADADAFDDADACFDDMVEMKAFTPPPAAE